MQINHYQKFYINRLFVPVLMILLTLLLLGITKYNIFRLNSRLNFYNDNNQKIQKQIDEMHDNVRRINKTYKVWMNLGDKILTHGLEIERCRSIISDLKDKYHLNELDVKVSPPIIRDDVSNQYIRIEYSEITLVGTAYTDLDIFNFINDLLKLVPGYLQITTLKIMNNYNFSNEVLVGITKGVYKDLVSVNMKIIWQAINQNETKLGNHQDG